MKQVKTRGPIESWRPVRPVVTFSEMRYFLTGLAWPGRQLSETSLIIDRLLSLQKDALSFTLKLQLSYVTVS